MSQSLVSLHQTGYMIKPLYLRRVSWGGVGRPAMNINSINIIRFKLTVDFLVGCLEKKNVYIPQMGALQGTNVSNQWKRKIIFPATFIRDMFVPRRLIE